MATAEQLSENSRQGFEVQKQTCIGLTSDLSGNLRWGCGHAYDETPVGIAVYVRNDPVNLIDPDGRSFLSAIGGFFSSIGNAIGGMVGYALQYVLAGMTSIGQLLYGSPYQDMVSGDLQEAQIQLYNSPTGPYTLLDTGIVESNTANAINRAISAISRPECAALFGYDTASASGIEPSAYLSIMLQGGNDVLRIQYDGIFLTNPQTGQPLLSNATTDLIVGAVTNMQTGIAMNGSLITINTASYTSINSGNVDDAAATILHELGHALNDIYGAGTTQIADDSPSAPGVSVQNTNKIKTDCGL